MEQIQIWEIILLIILLSLSAFFSASETALMAMSKIRLRHLIEKEINGALLLERLLAQPNRLLGGILIGNNIVNIGAASLATSIATKFFPGDIGVAVATGVMTILVLIFGEITPKSFAKMNSEQISLLIARPIHFVLVILRPLVTIFSVISGLIIRILGGKPAAPEPFITEEVLKTMVGVSEEEGVLESEEKNMIFNVFAFGDLQARHLMIQRVDVIGLSESVPFEQLKAVIQETHLSRIPVYRDNMDSIIGVLYVKDLIFADLTPDTFVLAKYLRQPYYVFEKKSVASVFAEMKENRTHLSIVVDEHGGTAGIITMEDLIERIVGNIDDEYDEVEKVQIEQITENQYRIQGGTKIAEMADKIGVLAESTEFDSVGGYVFGLFGRVPEVNEIISDEWCNYTITTLEKNRITEVTVERKVSLDSDS